MMVLGQIHCLVNNRLICHALPAPNLSVKGLSETACMHASCDQCCVIYGECISKVEDMTASTRLYFRAASRKYSLNPLRAACMGH